MKNKKKKEVQNFIKIQMVDLVGSMNKEQRLELLKTIIDFYGCVTVKLNKTDEVDIGKEEFELDKTVKNECLEIKLF